MSESSAIHTTDMDFFGHFLAYLLVWPLQFSYFPFQMQYSCLNAKFGHNRSIFCRLSTKMRLRGHGLAWERSNSDKKRAGTRGSPATGRSNGCWSDIRKRNKHSLICHLCIPKNRNSCYRTWSNFYENSWILKFLWAYHMLHKLYFILHTL